MKILEICENYFERSGILVASENRLYSITAIIKNILVVVILGVLCSAGAGVYICYHHQDELENCIKSVMSVCGGLYSMGCYMSLKMNENEINKFIAIFRKTVDEGDVLFYCF